MREIQAEKGKMEEAYESYITR